MEQISLFVDISLKNKYFDEPPAYNMAGIVAPANAPVATFNKTSV
jgi:hypothetical protein